MRAIQSTQRTESQSKYLLSDKTNKIIIADKTFVDEKTLDHLSSNKFRELDHDPTRQIEAEANILLNRIAGDPDIKINRDVYKELYPQDSRAPVIQPLLKDHKPEFPNCKIRPVQPVTNSSIDI